jgi:predicted RNA-binding Zn-ribbon protein involved in translation (DUF1610 family)
MNMPTGFIIVCGDCGTELPDLEAIEVICPSCANAAGQITIRRNQSFWTISPEPLTGGVSSAQNLPDTVSSAAITAALAKKPDWEMSFLP